MELKRIFFRAAVVAVAFVPALPSDAVVQGIDVSHWQGNINWTTVKNSGVQFAFAKATEGVDFVDSRFVQYMNGAIAAGVPIGPYHFARVNSGESIPTDAIDEANDFVDAIQGYYNSSAMILRPVLDLENLPDNPVSPSVKGYTSKWVRDFSNTVQNRLGFAPTIYTNGNFAQNYLEADIAGHDLWFAKPTNTNNYGSAVPPTATNIGIWSEWKFWQWSSVGNIGGISPVDRDVFNGTMQELAEAYIPSFVAGDFNGDKVVDAADYTVWRDTLGQSVNIGLGADGNLNGVIDAGDYSVWKSKFGVPGAESSAVSPAAVPEPTAILILATVLVATSRLRLRIASLG